MIDRRIRPWIDPPLARAARTIAGRGISADAITIGACVLGLAGAGAIAFGEFTLALLLLIANRIADGLDGAIARATRVTDRGAFLDVALDFAVYAAVPLGFAAWNAPANALPAAFLLASFVANGCAFLAFSVMALKARSCDRRPRAEVDLLSRGSRRRLRDDRVHDRSLPVSRRVSTARDNFRGRVLRVGGRACRARMEAVVVIY
jgi:phosphatidylglycerophosphate synthase